MHYICRMLRKPSDSLELSEGRMDHGDKQGFEPLTPTTATYASQSWLPLSSVHHTRRNIRKPRRFNVQIIFRDQGSPLSSNPTQLSTRDWSESNIQQNCRTLASSGFNTRRLYSGHPSNRHLRRFASGEITTAPAASSFIANFIPTREYVIAFQSVVDIRSGKF